MTGARSAAIDEFVEEARDVSIADAMHFLPLGNLKDVGNAGEKVGPCPACGGTDRFGVNPSKGWLCRGSTGGKDAIGLAAHIHGLDLKNRAAFLEACSAVLGRPVPDGAEESEADRRDRLARIEARRRENERKAEQAEAKARDFRAEEQGKARGKWEHGKPDGLHLTYLARRLDRYIRQLPVLPFLRTVDRETYWHGQDERRNPVELFTGPAMVAPFVTPDGLVVGCHLTWIDLDRRPKFRPIIPDPDPKKRGEFLPSKKMRGSKTGGLIPLIGFYALDGLILPDAHRRRFVTGEGIENTLAVALVEGPRADTIYAAAGDLGNLAGPADAAGRFAHPTLKKPDKNKRLRPVWVSGALPRPDQSPSDAMQVPPWVREILLVADGDSEPVATEAAMRRGQTRLGAVGADATIVWPPSGFDFADILSLSPLGH